MYFAVAAAEFLFTHNICTETDQHLQLNEYQADHYFLHLSQNMTTDLLGFLRVANLKQQQE